MLRTCTTHNYPADPTLFRLRVQGMRYTLVYNQPVHNQPTTTNEVHPTKSKQLKNLDRSMWYVLLGGRVPTPLVHHRTFSQAKKACRSALILTPSVGLFRWGAASPNTPRTAGWWPAWSLRIEKLRDVGGRDRGFEMNLAASLSPGGSAEQSFLLEERYQQLERNFKAIVQKLRDRPEGSPPQLQALLKQMDQELKHQVLRAQGAGSGTAQRLVERESILQRSFEAVVALMSTNGTSHPSPAPSTTSEGEAPMTPAASGASPFAQHPWQPTASYGRPDGQHHTAATLSSAGLSTPASAKIDGVALTPPSGTSVAASPAEMQRMAEQETALREELRQKVAAAAAADERAAKLREELTQARPRAPRPPPPTLSPPSRPSPPLPRRALLRPAALTRWPTSALPSPRVRSVPAMRRRRRRSARSARRRARSGRSCRRRRRRRRRRGSS